MPPAPPRALVAAFLAAPLLVAACCRTGGSDSHDGSIASPEVATPPKTTPGQPTPPTTTATAPPPAQNAYGPDGLPATIPDTRSPVPTMAEWNAVPREISVRKSTPLGCETKMVREWLRVSCRGKNNSGGTPLEVKKVAGCTGDTYFFASGGVTSLVTPVLRGKTCDVSFSWTVGANQLWVRWPNGAPRPTIAFQD